MKKQITGLLALTCILTVFLSTTHVQAQQLQQAEQLLQAAINKQLVEGDLEAAIEIYENILNRFPSNKPVAAKSLVQLGRCYEKLGDEKAREAYERVLRDYGDQSAEVAEARARLTVLSASQVSTLSTGPGLRKIFDLTRDIVLPAIFPDGQRLAYAEMRGDIAVYDINNQESRFITDVKGMFSDPYGGFPLISIVSPDGRYVVCNWEGPEDFSWELRKIKVDDGTTTLVYDSEAYLHPHDWSPDGKYIVAVDSKADNKTHEIVVVSSDGGLVSTIKTLEWYAPEKIVFSPDGEFIAYDYRQSKDALNLDIFIMPVEGGAESRVVNSGANDRLLAWAKNGNIFFASNRTSRNGIWALLVDNGSVSGAPELIRQNLGEITPIGTSQNGDLYFSMSYYASELLLGEFDFNSGELVGFTMRANPHSMGGTGAYWSRNGRYLVYNPPRNSRTPFGFGKHPVSLLDTQNGTTLSVEPQIVSSGPLRISSDGNSLLVRGRDSQDQEGLHLVDMISGNTELIISINRETESMWSTGSHWSHDDKAIFYEISDKQENRAHRTMRILKYDLESKTSSIVFQSTGIWRYWISPDDQWIVYSYQDPAELEAFDSLPQREQLKPPPSMIMLLNVSSGEQRQLCQMPRDPSYNASWSPDGSEIRFIHRIIERIPTDDGFDSEVRGDELWRIPLDGSDPIVLPTDAGTYNMKFNPDGRRVVYSKTLSPRSTELWVMENFLPPPDNN